MRNFIFSLIAIMLHISGFCEVANGVIKGTVTDKDSGIPIGFAVVVVDNNTSLGSVADENGKYIIEGVKSGYQSLSVTAFGYVPTTTDKFLVSTSSEQTIDIKLEKISVDVGEVIVASSPYSSVVEAPVSNYAIRKQELEKAPGGNRDISKVIQTSPGVVSSGTNRNDVLVRGGGSNENRYYLDGIEIPILNHFSVQGGSGGNASLVNTDFLNGATFYSSAFPIESSNALSSVINLDLIDGNSEKFKAKLSVGASDLSASFDTPISKDGNTTMIASYRRSYLQLLFSALGLPFLPVYNDYQLKISHKIDESSKLTYLLIGSFDKNRLNADIEDPDASQTYMLGYIPENDQNSYTTGLVYDKRFSNNSTLKLVVSRNSFKNYLYKYKDNDPELAKTVDITTRQSENRLRAEYNFSTDSRYRFMVGASLDHGNYTSDSYQNVYVNDAILLQNFKSKLGKIDYGLFGSVSKSYFDGHLSTSLGMRVDGSSYDKQTANPLDHFSPRVNAIYRFDNKWSINAHAGRYYALPSYTTLGYSDESGELINKDNGLDYTSVWHYVAGVSFAPNTTSKLSVEGFCKQYDDFAVSLLDSLPISTSNFEDYTVGDVPAKSVGKGRAYGLEVSYRNSSIKNTVINISYTYLNSEFQLPDQNLEPSGIYYDSSWDVEHILNVVAIHSFPRNWDLGFKWSFTGGMPYTPYDLELSSRVDAWDASGRAYKDYSLLNQYRYDPYHQLDVRVDKHYFFNKWSLGFYFDVQNIYNFESYEQDIILPVVNSDGSYQINADNPLYYNMQSIANSTGGTVLPTLGVIIEF